MNGALKAKLVCRFAKEEDAMLRKVSEVRDYEWKILAGRVRRALMLMGWVVGSLL